jgi:hypothetical protein
MYNNKNMQIRKMAGGLDNKSILLITFEQVTGRNKA